MFSKIFKYDFKYVFKIWWIFATVTLGLSCGAGAMIRGMINLASNDIDNFLFNFLTAMGLFMILMLLCLFPIVPVVVSLVRYYKNFYSDEGYLTFTLPVKRSSLLNSKILNFLLFEVMSGLVLVVDAVIILLVGIKDLYQEIPRFIETVFKELQELWNLYLTIDVILVPLLLLAALLMSINIYYLCFTFGSVVTKRLKVLASIGIYFGISGILNVIQQIISYFTLDTLLNHTITYAEFADTGAPFTIFLLLCTVLYGAAAVVAYCINLHCIKNKLNLS